MGFLYFCSQIQRDGEEREEERRVKRKRTGERGRERLGEGDAGRGELEKIRRNENNMK